MRIDRLFHWSPSDRRIEILREGLKPYSEPTVTSGDYLWPMISLGVRPSLAWGYSGGSNDFDEIEEWDLWEVQLPANADVHIRPFWGSEIIEVKVNTAIPADHVWWVGTRRSLAAKESSGGS